jgi:hypothetical protein
MCAVIKNPLQRDGTSQQERLLKALLPENAKIDDRKMEDILSFAAAYGKEINYFNLQNEKEGDWTCFYDNDPCILLAMLATMDTDSIEAAFLAIEKSINDYLHKVECEPVDECEIDPMPGFYDALINLIHSVAMRIQHACKRLPDGHLLKDEIIALIKGDLHLSIIDNKQQDALIKLIGYDKASLPPLNDYRSFIQTPKNSFCACTKAWQLDQEGYDCIYPDNSFDLASLKTLFYIFFIVLLRIKQNAKKYFDECIVNNDTHQPHITLFLTFVYLFQYAIDQLNTLTSKHLLYYYEQVLCLHKQKEVPDQVHVIFEIAKNFHTHLVEEGTLLNAGKDDKGKQMVYALVEEVVVNKAKVEEIKTVYIDAFKKTETIKIDNVDQVFTKHVSAVHVAPIADSKDGFGDSFAKEEQIRWSSLGGNQNGNDEIGFSIASPMFMLSEGVRDVSVTLHVTSMNAAFKNAITPFLYSSLFRVKYSSGKDWVEMDDFTLPLLNSFFVKGKLDAYNLCFDNLSSTYVPAITKKAFTHEDLHKVMKLKSIKASSTKNAKEKKENIKENAEGAQKGYYYKIDFEKKTIEFLLRINEFAPPIAAIDTVKNSFPIDTVWPVLSMYVRQDDLANTFAYSVLKNIEISSIEIHASVKGVKNLFIQNDSTILNASREFFPFGIRPKKGANFYIGSNEIFHKKLNRLDINLEWANLPLNFTKVEGKDEFGSFYNKYVGLSETVTNNLFKASVNYLYNRAYSEIIPSTSLFVNQGTNTLSSSQVVTISDNENIKRFQRFPERNANLSEFTIDTQRGFVKLKLENSFFHDQYAKSLVVGSIKESALGGNATGVNLPGEPFSPILKSVSLNYSSSLVVEVNKHITTNGVIEPIYEQFFHLHPFGYKQLEIDNEMNTEKPVLLFPQFEKTVFEASENKIERLESRELSFTQGNLYIGLADAEPEQKVNILFQVLEGTGDNRYAAPDVEWSYLINNEWHPFKPFEIQDHTRADQSSRKSLLKSGIIEFSLPKGISSEKTTILNSKLHWIRAVAHEDPLPAELDSDTSLGLQRIAALPDLTAIMAQAGIAIFNNHENSLTHLATSLPAKTIAKFVDSRAGIKKLDQPYYSFDGRMPENDNQFFTRVSERLRHKNRAICIWDYEHMVLQAFPNLHKVKCLNHTGITTNILQGTTLRLIELSPGFVTLSVIPDLRNKNAINKIEPRVPVGMLDEIKLYLKKHTNLFVASQFAVGTEQVDYLQVLNPLYEQLKVKTCVRFYDGLDVAYYKYVLNQDLKMFLSPWAFDANKEINFGSTYHKSVILNFIEERKYVDVVLGFEVIHFKDNVKVPDYDADLIIPTTSRSILTSYNQIDAGKAYEHEIEFVPYDEAHPCPTCSIIQPRIGHGQPVA